MKALSGIRIKYLGRPVLILTMHLLFAICSAQFAGGDGSADNPYQVARAEHLDEVRNYLDAYFIQTSDINLTGEWSEGEGWLPIGNIDERFQGNYNGRGHRITGLTIDRDARHQGLFGYAMGATIQKVNLLQADIRGDEFVGGISGIAAETTIKQCTVSGDISGNNQVGGISGFIASQATVSQCAVSGSVTGTDETSFIGGVTGVNFDESLIINSYSNANVRGNREMIGGLAGWNFLGGVTNSYATGEISTTHQDPTQVGGLIGDDAIGQGVFVNSYWDIQSSGIDRSAGGIGRTTDQMTYPYDDNTYEDWDFVNIWDDDPERSFNDGYPYLSFQEFFDLEAPQITITIEQRVDGDYLVLNWEAVEDALSYLIFTSNDPYISDWGEPAAIVSETQYSQPVTGDSFHFFHVTASAEEAP